MPGRTWFLCRRQKLDAQQDNDGCNAGCELTQHKGWVLYDSSLFIVFADRGEQRVIWEHIKVFYCEGCAKQRRFNSARQLPGRCRCGSFPEVVKVPESKRDEEIERHDHHKLERRPD